MKKLVSAVLIFIILLLTALTSSAANKIPAFPGADGGGKYSQGARGSSAVSVYHVTDLGDSGRGTLRDAVSKGGRIIVFDISGAVKLKSQLNIKKSNLTILGQTAPGDGITICGGDILFDDGVKNIIMRYIKVRPTDKNGGEPDGIGGRFNSSIILDHCSVSWGVDELLTLYGGSTEDGKTVGSNLTVQNTIVSESLRMSNHVKGAHGYGAIWGGTTSSYFNNLLAHHDSRSPRLDRELQKTEVLNNVIYDWGQTNSAYGAEPYSYNAKNFNPSYVNWINNYYKAGPATASKLNTRIFDISPPKKTGDPKSQFYFSGNYIGTGIVTNYRNEVYIRNYSGAELLDAPIDMGEYDVPEKTAEEAYEYVLNNAGATLPRRDAVDARIINDVKNGTGRLVNNDAEVGGSIPIESETRVFKIPDEWLAENGLSGKAETDRISSGKFAGYTVIEAYVNDWTDEQSKIPPTNPNIIVQSPAISSKNRTIEGISVNNGEWTVVTEGEEVQYKASGIAVGGNDVVKMELYDGNTKIGEFDGDEIDTALSLRAGEHYLTCRAVNTRGEKTQSTTAIVYVKAAGAPGSYSFAEIRESGYGGYRGKGGASMDINGVYTVYGSGRITTKANDNCGFMYKTVSGDFDISVRIDKIPKFENQQVSGLMVRAGLETNAVMGMIGDGWWKNGENVRVFSRISKGGTSAETFFTDTNGNNCDNDKVSHPMPKYMRIQRNGNTLTFSVSNSGTDWGDNVRQPKSITYANLPDTLYVGLATDSASGVSVKECFSAAKFSRLTLNGESDVVIEEGRVPFLDTSFENAEWYIPDGSGNRSFELNGLGGNYGDALLFWGEVYRSFKPQNEKIVRLTTDFYTVSNSSVNEKAGARFMLRGSDKNGNTVKIKSVYAQHDLGFFTDYDEAEPRPNSIPYSDSKFELEKWYRVDMELDYETGRGAYSFKPYEVYNSQSETYTLGEPVFEYEFDFDTDVAVTQLHIQRRGGYEMYLDNVGAEVCVRPLLYVKDGAVTADAPPDNAHLIIAAYDQSGILTDARLIDAAAGEKTSVSLSELPKALDLRAFLWNEKQNPLCDILKIND